MELGEEVKSDLGVALNEATMLGAEVDTERSMAFVTFDVLTLPLVGPPPNDRRIQFVFHPIGRVAASLRLGDWNDAGAKVVPFELGDLLRVIEGFKEPVYGWEFFDLEGEFEKWQDRLSLDYRSGDAGMSHTITLFQVGTDRHLDLCIWFDSFGLRDGIGGFPKLDEFIAGGKRWWDGFYSGDPRTHGEGIVHTDRDGQLRVPPGVFDSD